MQKSSSLIRSSNRIFPIHYIFQNKCEHFLCYFYIHKMWMKRYVSVGGKKFCFNVSFDIWRRDGKKYIFRKHVSESKNVLFVKSGREKVFGSTKVQVWFSQRKGWMTSTLISFNKDVFIRPRNSLHTYMSSSEVHLKWTAPKYCKCILDNFSMIVIKLKQTLCIWWAWPNSYLFRLLIHTLMNKIIYFATHYFVTVPSSNEEGLWFLLCLCWKHLNCHI